MRGGGGNAHLPIVGGCRYGGPRSALREVHRSLTSDGVAGEISRELQIPHKGQCLRRSVMTQSYLKETIR